MTRPLVQLVLARLRAFYREPGAVFWVYGFPLLMVVALGIAFRANPVEKITVDVQAGPQAERVRDALLSQSTARSLTFAVQIRRRSNQPAAPAHRQDGSGGGRVPGRQLSVPSSTAAAPKAGSRGRPCTKRCSGGRPDRSGADAARPGDDSSPAAATSTSWCPGLVGMGLMGGGLWGVGFAIVDMRIRKLLKRFVATPMRRSDFLLGIMISRLVFMIPEVARDPDLRAPLLRRRR